LPPFSPAGPIFGAADMTEIKKIARRIEALIVMVVGEVRSDS